MAPPKQDTFADLFQLANGAGLRNSPASSQNALPLNSRPLSTKQPELISNWSGLDSLYPLGALDAKGSQVPAASNSSLTALPLSGVIDDDPFDFFNPQPKSAAVFHNEIRHSPTESSNNHATYSSNGPNLLDDEFTDAFLSEPPMAAPEAAETHEPVEVSPPPQPRRPSRALRPLPNDQTTRDAVLAELVSQGFTIDIANTAIDRVGPDILRCVHFIISGKAGRSSGQNSAAPGPQKDVGAAFSDFSTDLYKKASWFLDKSKRSVIKNISNFQQQMNTRDDDNGMPAWMKNQHKYKNQAVERRSDGSSYEDYGTDEENINSEELQRYIRAQRQRDLERQRERLEALGKSKPRPRADRTSSATSNGSSRSHENGEARDNVQRRPISRNSLQNARPVAQHEMTSAERRPSKSTESLQRAPAAVKKATVAAEKAQTAQKVSIPEDLVDLLGLSAESNLSRAQQFKQLAKASPVYVSASRQRKSAPAPQRAATSEQLNAFQQSDYDTFKQKGAEAFANGNYDEALSAYNKCNESLPASHELRVVILANLALTAIKIGDFRIAKDHCVLGLTLIGDSVEDSTWIINDKPIKYWYVRLLTRKAESLEMLESFSESLECYMALVSKFGVNDKKTMDAKRRVNAIVNPPKKMPAKPQKSVAASTPNVKVERVKAQHQKEKFEEQQKFELHDQVHEKLQKWSSGKEDNLRGLLMALSDVIPESTGFAFVTDKKITIGDLMLTKKVKINYMKVISSIHPDKLGKFGIEDRMICQGVFVALNRAWEIFKEQNNIA